MKKGLILVALTLTFALMTHAVMAAEDWQTRQIPSAVESGVICVLDNCMMNLSACDTPAAEKERDVIREKMFKDGMNKEQVYSYLAQTYGEKILAAPPKKGFNWVAWLTPLVATVCGGALVYLALEKWVSPSQQPEDLAGETNPEVDALLQDEIDRELRKYF